MIKFWKFVPLRHNNKKKHQSLVLFSELFSFPHIQFLRAKEIVPDSSNELNVKLNETRHLSLAKLLQVEKFMDLDTPNMSHL